MVCSGGILLHSILILVRIFFPVQHYRLAVVLVYKVLSPGIQTAVNMIIFYLLGMYATTINKIVIGYYVSTTVCCFEPRYQMKKSNI